MVDNPTSVENRVPRRRMLRMLTAANIAVAAGMLMACTTNETSRDAGGAGTQVAPNSGSDTGAAPDVIAAPLAVTGQTVEPVTGIQLTLPGEVQALTPERVGEGRTQVTYVWAGEEDWGYLVVEGPNSFAANDQSAAMIAATAERQRLMAARITPSEPRKLEWEGLTQCAQTTWTQHTVPPGWSQEATVDALALFCVADGGHAYTIVAYGPAGELNAISDAFKALCSTS